MFNHGFLCPNCGPIEKSKDKTIRKVKHKTCPGCQSIVSPWTRPINERIGRCSNCGGGSFKLAMYKGDLIRNCKQCDMVINPDTDEVIREGKAIK